MVWHGSVSKQLQILYLFYQLSQFGKPDSTPVSISFQENNCFLFQTMNFGWKLREV